MHHLAYYISLLSPQFLVCCKITAEGINCVTLQEKQKALQDLQRNIQDSGYLDRCGGQLAIAGFVQRLRISAEKVSSGMITPSIVLVSNIIRLHSSVRRIVSIIVPLLLAEELLNLLQEPRFCGIIFSLSPTMG